MSGPKGGGRSCAPMVSKAGDRLPFTVMNELVESASRLEQLETKVAHLEHALQQLSDALYVQQRELERVIERNRQLLDELDGGVAATSATAFEKPPHY